jgi:GTP-binding protein
MSLRNIAIIAHVDHGKTTLVDVLLRQSGTFGTHEAVAERAMDRNDLERERGITILAKCTALKWGDTKINIVDTPGHADFGGEVERILSMVNGVVLLVDAAEGPMPQTKFVTGKALALGLRPIVVINKVDRPDARVEEVHEEVFDLFVNLGADDKQLDFPTVYASGKEGWASMDLDQKGADMTCLLDLVKSYVPEPDVETRKSAPFSMLVTIQEWDNYLGRVITGRIESGRVTRNMPIHAIDREGVKIETGRATKLFAFRGLNRDPIEEAQAGDIIAMAGLEEASVSDTVAAPEVTTPIPALPIDPPTLAMTFGINDSPLAGREGTKVQSRVIRERLLREAESNVAIQIRESGEDSFEVAGRGELQLGVLIETMRREGFELSISRPRVLLHEDKTTGEVTEPIEEVQVDVDDEFTGVVVEKMSMRKAEMSDMQPSGVGKTRITFHMPSRGLIGFHGEFLTDTRGTGIMNRSFREYGAYRGEIAGRNKGVLISNGQGTSVAYALWNLEERGTMFIGAGEDVYEGMIIGSNSRDNDLEVNVLKGKQLTNIRAAGKDDAVKLTTPRTVKLEEAIGYIDDDVLLEVTPKSVRLRKRFLKAHERKKASRAAS